VDTPSELFGPSPSSLSGGRLSPEDMDMIERTRAVRDLLGAKWKVDVLYLLARGGRRHTWIYDHLLGISKKMLTDTLRGLERDGFVERTFYAEIPVRVEYSLTTLGWSMTTLLMAMFEWGSTHLTDVADARRRYDISHSERGHSTPHLVRQLPTAAVA
jgi:DNA-binding HxlR family transcriptional regulator